MVTVLVQVGWNVKSPYRTSMNSESLNTSDTWEEVCVSGCNSIVLFQIMSLFA